MTDPTAPTDPAALADLLTLHDAVDAAVEPIERALGSQLRCSSGCSSCCVDELTVFDIEAERIRRQYPAVLGEAPHPAGACAFLDAAGRCRVYGARPYVCRTQGLPLRWFEEDDDEEIVEQRDICPLNLDGLTPRLEQLPDEHTWLLGPVEEQLWLLQANRDAGQARRVRLRDLFSGG